MWPHGVCLLWNKPLLIQTVASNAVIALAYFSIPALIVSFVRRQRLKVHFRSVYLMFAAFITLCGLTHVMDIVVIWTPAYQLQAFVLTATAAVSIGTAFALVTVAREFSGLLEELKTLRANADKGAP